jgi:hypothetical protein
MLHFETERVGGLEIDHQMEALGLLNRKLRSFCPLQELGNISSDRRSRSAKRREPQRTIAYLFGRVVLDGEIQESSATHPIAAQADATPVPRPAPVLHKSRLQT